MIVREKRESMISLKLLILPLHNQELTSRVSTCSEEYVESSAMALLSSSDMKKLNVKDGDCIELSFLGVKVIVRVFELEKLSEGFIVLPPGPWAMSLLPTIINSEGQPVYGRITVNVKPANCPPTPMDGLV